MGGLLSRLCAEAGFSPRIRHEVDETSTLVTLVAAGLGVAIARAPIADLGIGAVTYLPLNPPSLGVDLVAAHIDGGTSPLMDRALSVLRAVISPRVEAVDATGQVSKRRAPG